MALAGLAAAAIGLVGLVGIGLGFDQSVALLLAVAVACGILIVALAETSRRLAARVDAGFDRLQAQQRDDFRQTEALVSLTAALDPVAPLPPTRGWAASPDFLRCVVESVFRKRPRLVVELGSGVSTIVVSYALKRLGQGKLLSLDHEADYAAATRARLGQHGLTDVAQVIHAPLRSVDVNGQSHIWYETSELSLPCAIDILVVDGPPTSVQSLARFPALALFAASLAPDGEVFLDDGHREDEQAVVRRWVAELGFAAEPLETEKGAFRLWRAQG